MYEHLAEIYNRKARYCLMLVSDSYATKAWTTHERRNAQARALEQKGEYILPVRFDNTRIPGLPSTIGYIRFQEHGAEGVCRLLCQRLRKPTDASVAPKGLLTTSPRACILDPDENLQAFIPVIECTWEHQEAVLMFEPDDATDGPFLDRLQGSRRSVDIAFKHNLGLCQIEDVQHIHKDGRDRWSVRLRITESDFTPAMEMGMQGLSADDIAERRARRILLDENPFVEGKGSGAKKLNEAALEVFIRGVNARFQPKGSPFPALYHPYNRQPDKFLEVAWILGVLLLTAFKEHRRRRRGDQVGTYAKRDAAPR